MIVGTGSQEREDWQPRGERIGWLDADDLFLDPESSFAAVQKLARDQGTSVPTKQRTLWKRLAGAESLVPVIGVGVPTPCGGRSEGGGWRSST